jgi:hypothetical protein
LDKAGSVGVYLPNLTVPKSKAVNIHGGENLNSQPSFFLFLSVLLVRPAGNISDVSCLLVSSDRTHAYFFQSKVTDVDII